MKKPTARQRPPVRKPSSKPASRSASKSASRSANKPASKRSRRQGSPRAEALLTRLRQICLELPEATEVEAWGHPTFRVKNKIFCGFGGDDDRAGMSVKTTMDMQAALVSSDPRFTIAAYVGKHGWVSLDMSDKVDWGEIEVLVRGSYNLVAPADLAGQLD